MAYAEKTSVSVAHTKADIEDIVQQHGADQFVAGYRDNIAMIGFTMSGRQIRFILPLPDKAAREYWYTPGRGQKRSEDAAHAAWEQACRSRWRALYLIVKAKLEAVDAGISTVEREFLYDIVLPDGRTAGEWMAPQLEAAYQTGHMPAMQCTNCLCERCVNNVENLWSKIRPEEQIISCFNCDECCYYTGGCNYKLQKKEDCEDFVISDYAAVSRRKKIKVL